MGRGEGGETRGLGHQAGGDRQRKSQMGKGPWGPSKRDNKDNNNNCYTLNEHIPVPGLARWWIPGFYQISSTCRKQIRKRGSEMVSDVQVTQSVL